MPKLATPLTETQVRNAKPGIKPKGSGREKVEVTSKPYTLADGQGLYLLVNPDGSKYWRMQYRFGGKTGLLSFGKYPEISLQDARKLRHNARDKLNAGNMPLTQSPFT